MIYVTIYGTVRNFLFYGGWATSKSFPNCGSRVLLNLSEAWHQEGLQRLTERMDCNEQARKDSFASQQLNGCDLLSSPKMSDSRYFTSNMNHTITLLYDAMLTSEIT